MGFVSTDAGAARTSGNGYSCQVVNAIRLLQESHRYASQLAVGAWEFAVEVGEFYHAGVTRSTLRWLILKGYAEHGVERFFLGRGTRKIRRVRNLTINDRTCFVLTELGTTLATHILNGASDGHAVQIPHGHAPVWDGARRELRLGRSIVKRFMHAAPNQELVLSVFQEEGWPARIDDPLPPIPDRDPAHRLHNTINKLNQNQLTSLIRFRGSGDGRGVLWEMAPEPKLLRH